MKNLKNDIILIVALFLTGIVILLFVKLSSHSGATVQVRIDGEIKAELPLSEDAELLLEGYDGGSNLLIIKDGYARISDASCPDGLCIGMGDIHLSGQSIICLPNRVVIEIKGSDSEDVIDGVTGSRTGAAGEKN